MHHYNNKNLGYAKVMRSNMTEAETKLWHYLRAKRFYGIKFKRQVLIGDFIVDFLSVEKMLIIEVDGGQHSEDKNVKYDEERTKFLESLGYIVIRFWNNDILNDIEGVLDTLREYVI